MERSRSKRNYSYDQENDTETVGRTRPRYNHHYASNSHRHRDRSGSTARPSKPPDSPATTVTTSYRILCRDVKVGGVVGKSGSIIKSIRQHTGACVNVHELIPGDEERIIEISDTRRRDPDGRMPSFSPAQEALFLIHERILESDGGGGFGMGYHGGEEDEYRGMGGNNMVTRLVVLRMHVGCLMGKRGKIIERMRIETKTHIRILPRDHTLPRCVSTSEEIVQVVGDVNAVKNAIAIISSRLRESQHRDRSHLHGRSHSPDPFFPPDDDYVPHMNNAARRSSMDGASNGSQSAFSNIRSNNYASRPSAFTIEPGAGPIADNMEPFYGEDLVFRILCPINKINSVVGESDGIVELLQNEIGVDVKVADPVAGSDEQIITISSEEGPDDELFPAQEALLHIQTRIVDLVPDKDNIVTTRLLIPASDIVCLEGISLSEMRKLTGANIQLLPREGLPACVPRSDELLQIVGEIKAARGAIVEVTSRLRSYLYREFFQMEAASPNNIVPGLERHTGSDPPSTSQNVRTVARQPSKEAGGSGSETAKHNQCDHREDVPVNLNRTPVPLVTRSTLEVVIPEYAVPKLITKSRNKLAQISELSGANMTLVDDRRKVAQNIIQISGTPDQAERAQSLLQGFILSSKFLYASLLVRVCVQFLFPMISYNWNYTKQPFPYNSVQEDGS